LACADARDAPVLTDDLDVRDAARTLGIRAIGSIGIILRAITTRVLPRAEGLAALDALLEDSSMYVTRALVEQAKAAEQAAWDKRRP
jgi:predicted nucleic acid-binding protein